jgi:hypothetical protein
MERHKLLNLIDWDLVMKAPRGAGGHDEVMQSIFGSNAVVVAHWNEGDYQGTVMTAYLFADDSVGIISDGYGSCSGCDSWDGASDEDARSMITSLVDSCRLCSSMEEAIDFCASVENRAYDYLFNGAVHLGGSLKKMLAIKNNPKEMPLYIHDEDDLVRNFVLKELSHIKKEL